MESGHIRADKSYGQHFLHEAGIIHKILRFASPLADRHVIEIGPGPGALTRALIAETIASLDVVEVDARMLETLEHIASVSTPPLRIHHQDALKLEVTALCPTPRVIVANLPYNVATPLLVKWLHAIHASAQAFERLTLMFQKEVAERITAAPDTRDYGRLAVLAQWLCKVEYGFDISPGCFTPPPKVMSAVVRLTPYSQPLYEAPRDVLEKLLAAGFNQRRKMLRSALKSYLPQPEAILERVNIDATRRAETLSVQEWCALARIVA